MKFVFIYDFTIKIIHSQRHHLSIMKLKCVPGWKCVLGGKSHSHSSTVFFKASQSTFYSLGGGRKRVQDPLTACKTWKFLLADLIQVSSS